MQHVRAMRASRSNRIFDNIFGKLEPIERAYAKPSAKLHIRDQVQVYDAEGLLFAHMEFFESVNTIDSTHSTSKKKKKNKTNLFWRLSTLSVVAEREMHTKQANRCRDFVATLN